MKLRIHRVKKINSKGILRSAPREAFLVEGLLDGAFLWGAILEGVQIQYSLETGNPQMKKTVGSNRFTVRELTVRAFLCMGSNFRGNVLVCHVIWVIDSNLGSKRLILARGIVGQLLDLISPAKINLFDPRFKSYDPWDMANCLL